MNYWFISIVHVISTCTATKILYVLPDNVSDVNCPSQPCATLDQYLLDNGSLPVLLNAEYFFLPGEHHIVNVIDIEGAINFSLNGFSVSPAKLVCQSQSYLRVFYSYKVTIRNLVFDHCSSDLLYDLGLDVATSLLLDSCIRCKVEDVYFFGYGFAGINLIRNSYLSNITIDMTIETPSLHMCGPKFYLMFWGIRKRQQSILINQISVSGYNEMCYGYHEAMKISLQNTYFVSIKLFNTRFYNMNQVALNILMSNSSASLLIKTCSFMYLKHEIKLIEQVVNGNIINSNVAVSFENCIFHYNNVLTTLGLQFENSENLNVYVSNLTIENCDFIKNIGNLLYLDNTECGCKVNVFFNEIINIAKNEASFIMYLFHMTVIMNGTITVSENYLAQNIMELQYCSVTFIKTITFLSNICNYVINLISMHSPYITVMENTNITFTNISYRSHLIDNNYLGIFPYCIFQYTLSNSNTYNISELIKLYTISFNINKPYGHASNYSYGTQVNNIHDFLTHCKWQPTTVFTGYKSDLINQQIIQVDGHQWIHHKRICYCPHDGDVNCTVNLLGPVYPGQKLQVDLCMPHIRSVDEYILHAETHATSLPNSVCRIARQHEFINTISSHPKIYNFIIISKNMSCELFFVVQNFIRTVFYVQLSPCPVGFTLRNGKCDCDPFLPPDIDTCYIDLSAITRPANTWITAHTLTNNTTNYLISDCPMDYCLPYSTNVNLLYPDLQCQFNRTGMLCSQCQHPLSMVFASSRCMKCTNVHILITIIVIVAGIVLVVLLYVLNLTVTKGTINGIIFYANIVSINDSVFLVNDNVFKPLRVFISFTNLDLGIETCFYDGMDSYAKMWLQLFFPFYLIIIAVSIIIASRYSSRILRLTYSRSLPVLATLFLLSYTGVLRVVLTVLFSYSTITEYPSGDKEIVWSIDASVPLFGLRFTILFITCLVLFLILIPFNITLLFRRYLAQFRIVNYFKPLLDAFHGSYKDRYYYWIAVHIILRSILFSLYGFQVRLRLFLTTIVLVLFSLSYGYLQPNKNKLVNIQELFLLANLVIMYISSILNSESIFLVVVNLMMSFAFVQFCLIVLCHFLTYTFHCNVAIKENLAKLWNRKKPFDVALLNIPERTYNYNQYQDGLVSDDFK